MGTDSYFRSIQLGSVTLRVADLGRALAFYEGVLGFDAAATGPHSATLAAGPNGSVLLELEASPAAPARRPGEAGLFHVALLFPTRASLGRMLTHLASADVRLGAADHGVSEALYLADPEGNGLELYVDRPAAAWPALAADGQVTMFTEALDLTALAAAGAEAQGPMLPRDVRVGHIHLAVSSIAKSRICAYCFAPWEPSHQGQEGEDSVDEGVAGRGNGGSGSFSTDRDQNKGTPSRVDNPG